MFFIIPIIFVFILIEFRLRQVPNPYKYKYEWMQKNAEDVEILVFGSSHTYFGIRPEFFDGKAFSLANVSQDTKLDLFLLKYWAKKYKHLKVVIVPISYFTWFSHGLEYGKESFRCRYYSMYMDCDLYPCWPQYHLELSDIETAKKKADKIGHEEYNNGDYDNYGWGTIYKLSSKNMTVWESGTDAEAAVKRHTATSWDHVADNLNRMREMALFCKNNHIQLVLITTPCWHTYYNRLDPKQLKKMHELNNLICRDYDFSYFDYLKDQRFVANDFYDGDHLSDIGAEKFTKILSEDIKSLP